VRPLLLPEIRVVFISKFGRVIVPSSGECDLDVIDELPKDWLALCNFYEMRQTTMFRAIKPLLRTGCQFNLPPPAYKKGPF
jgi:hypothetical protein